MVARSLQQRDQRRRYAKLIVRKVSKVLDTEENRTRMQTTNRVLPQGSLKRQCVKAIFGGWIRKFVGKGRILTKKLSRQVCRDLRAEFDLEASDPTDNSESDRMHRLLKIARKRQILKPPVPAAMSVMDTCDTQPIEELGFKGCCKVLKYCKFLLLHIIYPKPVLQATFRRHRIYMGMTLQNQLKRAEWRKRFFVFAL